MPTEKLDLKVEQLLLQGCTRQLMLDVLQAEGDAVSLDEINEAIACAVERWISDAETADSEVYAYHVRLRKHLYQKSYKLNDFKTCLAVAQDLAKLQQQYVAKKKEEREKEKTGRDAEKYLRLLKTK